MCRACGGTRKFPLFTHLIDCPYCVTGEAIIGEPPATLADEFKSPKEEPPATDKMDDDIPF